MKSIYPRSARDNRCTCPGSRCIFFVAVLCVWTPSHAIYQGFLLCSDALISTQPILSTNPGATYALLSLLLLLLQGSVRPNLVHVFHSAWLLIYILSVREEAATYKNTQLPKKYKQYLGSLLPRCLWANYLLIERKDMQNALWRTGTTRCVCFFFFFRLAEGILQGKPVTASRKK